MGVFSCQRESNEPHLHSKKLVSLYQALSNVMIIDHEPVVHKLQMFFNQ